ncbi:uncharacterized protein DS421_20g688870 [Arachis hypogaea]|nr:uncharacterized protein DS421_20g688870 [Arachis hypogaea]
MVDCGGALVSDLSQTNAWTAFRIKIMNNPKSLTPTLTQFPQFHNTDASILCFSLLRRVLLYSAVFFSSRRVLLCSTMFFCSHLVLRSLALSSAPLLRISCNSIRLQKGHLQINVRKGRWSCSKPLSKWNKKAVQMIIFRTLNLSLCSSHCVGYFSLHFGFVAVGVSIVFVAACLASPLGSSLLVSPSVHRCSHLKLLIFGLLASNFLVAFCSRRLLGSWLGADLLCTAVVLELAGNSFSSIELALSFSPYFQLRSLLAFMATIFANSSRAIYRHFPLFFLLSLIPNIMDFFSFTNIFSVFFWSLQKYRLGKSQPQLEICSGNNKHEDCREMNNSEGPCSSREETIGTQNEMTESMRIAEALQMQMEVQKKLYEQIELQRHLQLKIEAQGKYLQSVLHKAQETLAGMINNGSPGSPPILELTETRGGFS